MDEGTEKPVLIRFAEHLQRHGVEFVVIGGQAAALLGSPVPTFDVDLCYRRTADNLRRLALALAKRHLRRAKDQAALVQLDAIQRLREQGGSRP